MIAQAALQEAPLEQLVVTAVDQINSGSIKLADLLTTLSPVPAQETPEGEVPIPLEITAEQRAALFRVIEVFGKVVPSERRKLTPDEVSMLIEEKETLDSIKKMAEARLDTGVKVAIHNHLDVEAEEHGFGPETSPRNKDGHYVLEGIARGNAASQKVFKREVANYTPTVALSALEALENDPEVQFDHSDFLAITSPTRVLDENKLMLHMRKNPHLVLALAKAITPGKVVASINLRKA